MTFRNPLAPPDPNELQSFGESVNNNRTPYYQGIRRTLGDTRKAVGGLVGDTVGLPFQIPKLAGNIIGWGFGAMSGTSYKISHAADRVRGGFRKLLTGEDVGNGA
jgi:hypothetical protein